MMPDTDIIAAMRSSEIPIYHVMISQFIVLL